MTILILNQHTSNHGDEAAGKSLIRGLRNKKIKYKIEILYNSKILLNHEKFDLDDKVTHLHSGKVTLIDKIIILLTFLLPFRFISKFFFLGSSTKYEYNLIKNAQKVINGPGGVNIGPYKDWKYIWRLYVALKLKKDTAIYSISFGPIPKNFLFKKISEYILKNVNFLSLRDKQSQRYADELKLKYIVSIDTAFLNNQPDIKLSIELSRNIKEEYVVIVPNQLNNWHPNFKKVNENKFSDLYSKIIKYFISKNIQVILLPQLYGNQNDSRYFEKLITDFEKKDNIYIVDDNYSSDIQQTIIKNALFLVGARYHSIIFSINNETSFLSLSYEHKMTNTLELLDLTQSNVLIEDIINNKIDIQFLLNSKFKTREKNYNFIKKSSDEANLIANQTLDILIDNFLLKN